MNWREDKPKIDASTIESWLIEAELAWEKKKKQLQQLKSKPSNVIHVDFVNKIRIK